MSKKQRNITYCNLVMEQRGALDLEVILCDMLMELHVLPSCTKACIIGHLSHNEEKMSAGLFSSIRVSAD